MAYSILNLKQDLTGILHGTQLNQIQNLDGVINRAARQLLLDIDPQETKRSLEFVTPIFNSVFDYAIAPDVKGNKIIDIYPQVQRIPLDIWTQAYNQAFDVAKQNIFSANNMFTINFNTSLKTIRINAPYLNPPVIISQIDNIDNNGTWTTGGVATNLTVNNTNFAQGAGSLQFDVTGAGDAYIENTTLGMTNLSEVVNQSSIFTWVYVPDASLLTSVTVRWGSSNTDYYQETTTQTQQGTVFVNGWNLCEFVWATASSVGSPDASNITYGRVSLAMTGASAGVKVNGLDSILGTVLNYEYYSKYMFRDAITGAYQETVTDDSNLVNLDTESFNLLLNQVVYLATQQQQGLDATFYDGGFFKNAYDTGIIRYKSMYKSELQKPQSVYYQQPDTSYNRIIGRGFQ